MKILIQSRERTLRIPLPTGLVLSPLFLGLAFRNFSANGSLPPEATRLVSAELRRVRAEYGTWELVDIHSADGTRIKIVL